jgi:hypothetical protein
LNGVYTKSGLTEEQIKARYINRRFQHKYSFIKETTKWTVVDVRDGRLYVVSNITDRESPCSDRLGQFKENDICDDATYYVFEKDDSRIRRMCEV